MNVFIYGGLSRFEAKTSIIRGNVQPELNKVYSIEYAKGMLVIAFPNKQDDADVDMPTALGFEYWIHPFSEEEIRQQEEEEANQQNNSE